MNAKRKGTAGENELVGILKEYGIRAYRNDQIYQGGKNNPDVFAEIADEPFHVEVKRVERLNVCEAMRQAVGDAKPGFFPALAHRRNREEWLVTVPLRRILDMLREKGIV